MDGFNRQLPSGHGRAVEDQRAVGHVARRRRACRRLDRRREARPRHARATVEGRARRVRTRRRGAARRVDAARYARSTTSRSARRPRSIWRRTSRTCCSTTCRPELRDEIYEWLGDEREGRTQGDRLRRAVLLQDAQEGARSVQAAALGSCPTPTKRRAREGVRREVHASCSTSWRSATRRAIGRALREARRRSTASIRRDAVAVAAAPDDAELSD